MKRLPEMNRLAMGAGPSLMPKEGRFWVSLSGEEGDFRVGFVDLVRENNIETTWIERKTAWKQHKTASNPRQNNIKTTWIFPKQHERENIAKPKELEEQLVVA